MYFRWTDDLNTGIAEIDLQHQRIGDYINTLHDVTQGGERKHVGEVLDQLLDYTVNHFLFEEQLMEKAGYEFRLAHERVHEVFGKRVAEYRGRYAKGDDIAEEVLTMLKNWLGGHIRQEDHGYLEAVRRVVADENDDKWVAGLVKRLFG